MQISGRVIILTMFGLALALSGGAWFYHYLGAGESAAFWGSPAGRLIVRGAEVTFFELGEFSAEAGEGERIAGRTVKRTVDLSGKPGLIHLRHVFTQDSNFEWEGRRRKPVSAAGDWAYAVRFAEGDSKAVVLFRRGFGEVGKLEGDVVEVLPAPRIGESVTQYLMDVGALEGDMGVAGGGEAKPQAAR